MTANHHTHPEHPRQGWLIPGLMHWPILCADLIHQLYECLAGLALFPELGQSLSLSLFLSNQATSNSHSHSDLQGGGGGHNVVRLLISASACRAPEIRHTHKPIMHRGSMCPPQDARAHSVTKRNRWFGSLSQKEMVQTMHLAIQSGSV